MASYEFRDPIHTFIRMNDSERRIVDSLPVQRLRQIHQLAMTYLVYPGASHKRFEHSLGVMELSGRIFDSISRDPHGDLPKALRNSLTDPEDAVHWRSHVRVAALTHDVGHLPFSHAAEEGLLAPGEKHEHLTVRILQEQPIRELLYKSRPICNSIQVARLAVGTEVYSDLDDTEAILSETITGSVFGADRMDYLLRDSLHAGVAYGNFDLPRLIGTLRLLPPPRPAEEQGSTEPKIGIEHGGIHTAEALLLARYFMFMQVYLHRVRRAYDLHFLDFMKEFVAHHLNVDQGGITVERHLRLTDSEVLAALNQASLDTDAPGHQAAKRICERGHFRVLWERDEAHIARNPDIGPVIFREAEKEFGSELVRYDKYPAKLGA